MAGIKRVNLNQQIADGVLDILRNGGYKVGDRIPTEKEFCEELCVGRNSIREVTKSLALMGVLESIPGKGTFLKSPPSDTNMGQPRLSTVIKGIPLQDLIDARRVIEPAAAGLAAIKVKNNPDLISRLEVAEKGRMQSGFSRAKLNEDLGDDPNSGFELHKLIVELSGNQVLQKIMVMIYDELQQARALFPVSEEEYASELDYHHAIVQAIKSGDSEAASNAMRIHLDNTERIYSEKEGKWIGKQ